MVYIGNYEILSHSEMPDCSLRLLRLTRERHVERHYHEKSAQVYVVLEGKALVSVEDRVRELAPYESMNVPKRVPHSIASDDGALILSISIPPLADDDQHLAR